MCAFHNTFSVNFFLLLNLVLYIIQFVFNFNINKYHVLGYAACMRNTIQFKFFQASSVYFQVYYFKFIICTNE